MKVVVRDVVSVYETFLRYGFSDGESPVAPIVLEAVLSVLEEHGLQGVVSYSIHNNYIHQVRRAESGVVVAELHNCGSPGEARDAFLAAGLTEVVAALDHLDAQTMEVDVQEWVWRKR